MGQKKDTLVAKVGKYTIKITPDSSIDFLLSVVKGNNEMYLEIFQYKSRLWVAVGGGCEILKYEFQKLTKIKIRISETYKTRI